MNVPGVIVTRYEPDGTAVTFGEASGPDLGGAERFLGVGASMPPDPGSLAAQVRDTQAPARVDDFSALPGTVGELARAARLGSGCASPIVVNGTLWGKLCVFSRPGTVLSRGNGGSPLRLRRARCHGDRELRVARRPGSVGCARRELADEQAALRRVATLVARGVGPEEVFSAVTNEIAQLFGSSRALVGRFEPDGSAMVVVGEQRHSTDPGRIALASPEDYMASTRVYRAGHPVRVERSDFEHVSGPMADVQRKIGAVSIVAAPIVVEGKQWGL